MISNAYGEEARTPGVNERDFAGQKLKIFPG